MPIFINGNKSFKHHCRGLWKATAGPHAGRTAAGRGLGSYAHTLAQEYIRA
jgi:hypothetical protein